MGLASVSQIPNLEKSELNLVTIGKKCGSTYIDRELMNIVRERLGHRIYQQLEKEIPEGAVGGHDALGPSLSSILGELQLIKENFNGSSGDRILRLPGALGRLNIPESNIKAGDLTLSE